MGAVDTTYTFTATDTITSTKMNNIIDQTTMTTDAIIGTTLDVASGKLKVRSSGITSNEMGANSVVTAAIVNANVTTAKIADSNVTTEKIADANITAPKLNGAQTGTAPIYAARAWVNFNGFSPLTVRASGNVSSVVRNAVGVYTITFTTPMPDANYQVSGTAGGNGNHPTMSVATAYDTAPTASSLRIVVGPTGGATTNGFASDANYISVAVFR